MKRGSHRASRAGTTIEAIVARYTSVTKLPAWPIRLSMRSMPCILPALSVDQPRMRLARPLPRWQMCLGSSIAAGMLGPSVDAAVLVVVAEVEVFTGRDPCLLFRLAFLEAAPAERFSCFDLALGLAA